MYETHFGFSGPPFQLNPDPAFYFNSKGHSRAMGYLQYGVMQGEGFIVITGEIGAGKTTLLRTLLEGLDRQKVLAAQIVSTQLESGELLQAIITAFGIPAQGSSKAHLIATLEAFLTALAAQGRHALLIVDEAQNLDERAVEELRMLSNFQLGNHALLQSFLVGQPELRRLLESPQMEQLRQRVIASQHLGPLGPDETQAYIEHRLRRVGWQDRPAFAPGAFDHIYAWTGGVPRRINRLSNRLLLASYLENTDQITPELVEQTALELRNEIGEAHYQPLPLPVRERSGGAPAAAPAPGVEPGPAPAAATQPAPGAMPPAAPLQAAEPAPEPAATRQAGEPLSPPASPAEAPADRVVPSAPPPAQASAATPPWPAARSEEPLSVQATAAAQGVAGVDPGEPSASERGEGDTPAGAPLDVAAVGGAVAAAAAHYVPEAVEPLHQRRAATARYRGVVLCLADTAQAALNVAAIARAMPRDGQGLRLLLVNPGRSAQVWPWQAMDRLLPAPEEGVHLELHAAPFATQAPRIIAAMDRLLAEFQPLAVAVAGDSDALLAGALTAHKAGLPLWQLMLGTPRDEGNAVLIARMAQQVLAPDRPESASLLQQQGLEAGRCRLVPDGLAVQALAALWPEVTTPYGAFLRHAMPIYLGPTWSEHAGAGTPYVLCTLTLPDAPDLARQRLQGLLDVQALPKILWLLDRDSEATLTALLAAEPALAQATCLLHGEGPRSAAERDRMDRARLLGIGVPSLCDQLSMLRGARCAIVEPGQVLAEAARWLSLPSIEVDGAQLRCTVCADVAGTAVPLVELGQCVHDLVSSADDREIRQAPEVPGTDVAATIAHSLLEALAAASSR
ncbi:MAG: XrtA-associated ATPase [Burkholderiaceae bacterium]|nr:XrtA-associated ATPase [Burkholderiaceae bacterium]